MAETAKAETDGKEYLAVLFPGEEVDIGGGTIITVRPLTLENLKDVVDAFQKVVTIYRSGEDSTTIIFNAFKEVMELLPYCIDREMKTIPSGAAPDLLEAFLRQNLAEEVLGKWTALIQTMGKELGKRVPNIKDLAAVTNQGSDTK